MNDNQIIIYQSDDGETHIDVTFTDETSGFRSSFAIYIIQAKPM